jgi:hypothetical protein
MDCVPSLSLADAWQQLLDSYMPFLVEEAMLAASALMLYQPGNGWDASGQRSEQVGAVARGWGGCCAQGALRCAAYARAADRAPLPPCPPPRSRRRAIGGRPAAPTRAAAAAAARTPRR